MVVDGPLEGGGLYQAGDVVDRRAADAGLIFLDGPDLGRDPELDLAEIAMRAIVPFQAGRKRGREPLEDLCRRDVRRYDDQQAVTAVLPPAHVPDGPQGKPGHGQRLPADDLLGFTIALVRVEAHHIGADNRAVLPGQRQRPGRRRARREVPGRQPPVARLVVAVARAARALAQPEIDLFLDDFQDGRVGADERGEVRRPHNQGHHRLQGHHRRGADVDFQGGPLADQLTRAAFGHHPLGAMLADPDLGEPAEDDGHVIGLLPFPHEPGAHGEHPVLGLGPEEPFLIGVETVPEIAGHSSTFVSPGEGRVWRPRHGSGRSGTRHRLGRPVSQARTLRVRQALIARQAGLVLPVPAAREAELDLQRPPGERARPPQRYLGGGQRTPRTVISGRGVLVGLTPAESAK
jgi:hypothetical protein